MTERSTWKRQRTILKESQSPVSSFKSNGITLSKAHLPRKDVVDDIFEKADKHQIVVVASPASTGKTSLLQLIRKRLIDEDQEGLDVVKLYMRSDKTSDYYTDLLANEYGIDSTNQKKVDDSNKKVFWLLLDDAQNCYDIKFNLFWQFLNKAVESGDFEGQLYVIIASTYDLSTKGSPVDFRNYVHIYPDATEDETGKLLDIHMDALECKEWAVYRESMLKISKLASHPSGETRHHIGVGMAGMRLIAEKLSATRKRPRDLQETFF